MAGLARRKGLVGHIILKYDFEFYHDFNMDIEALGSQPYQTWYREDFYPEVPSFALMSSIGLAPYKRAFREATSAEAALRIALHRAALELFRDRHGSYPAALAELVPDTVAELPLDPYTEKPFAYEITPGGYRLSSPGPDLAVGGDEMDLRNGIMGKDSWEDSVDYVIVESGRRQ